MAIKIHHPFLNLGLHILIIPVKCLQFTSHLTIPIILINSKTTNLINLNLPKVQAILNGVDS